MLLPKELQLKAKDDNTPKILILLMIPHPPPPTHKKKVHQVWRKDISPVRRNKHQDS